VKVDSVRQAFSLSSQIGLSSLERPTYLPFEPSIIDLQSKLNLARRIRLAFDEPVQRNAILVPALPFRNRFESSERNMMVGSGVDGAWLVRWVELARPGQQYRYREGFPSSSIADPSGSSVPGGFGGACPYSQHRPDPSLADRRHCSSQDQNPSDPLVPTASTLSPSLVYQFIGSPMSAPRADEAIGPATGRQVLLASLLGLAEATR
jgi:hypothetical protein